MHVIGDNSYDDHEVIEFEPFFDSCINKIKLAGVAPMHVQLTLVFVLIMMIVIIIVAAMCWKVRLL